MQAQAINIDSGVSERAWDPPSPKPDLDTIVFNWGPTRSQQDTIYFLEAFCNQVDLFGQPSGKNKVTFQNVVMLGADSDIAIAAPNQGKKVKKGIGKIAGWDITPAIDLFATDSSVVVAVDVKTSKPVRGDSEVMFLSCRASVYEVPAPEGMQSASSEERLRYFRRTFGKNRRP